MSLKKNVVAPMTDRLEWGCRSWGTLSGAQPVPWVDSFCQSYCETAPSAVLCCLLNVSSIPVLSSDQIRGFIVDSFGVLLSEVDTAIKWRLLDNAVKQDASVTDLTEAINLLGSTKFSEPAQRRQEVEEGVGRVDRRTANVALHPPRGRHSTLARRSTRLFDTTNSGIDRIHAYGHPSALREREPELADQLDRAQGDERLEVLTALLSKFSSEDVADSMDRAMPALEIHGCSFVDCVFGSSTPFLPEEAAFSPCDGRPLCVAHAQVHVFGHSSVLHRPEQGAGS